MKIEYSPALLAWFLYGLGAGLISIGFGVAGGFIAFVMALGTMILIAALMIAISNI